VLGLNDHAGYTGDQMPVYDALFAGGFSSLRGFEFHGAGPHANSVLVGGFVGLTGAEYLFPITADDSLRGVLFLDTGTVEPSIKDMEHYRVVPGFGLRITIPTMGPAPIALDFAFTVGAGAIGDVMTPQPLGAAVVPGHVDQLPADPRHRRHQELLGRSRLDLTRGPMQPQHGLVQHVVGLFPSSGVRVLLRTSLLTASRRFEFRDGNLGPFWTESQP
jgi:hypothetical protein